MQAIILAAGYGKRLQPLTNITHKSLVEINGVPLLINALNCLSGRDISEVIIVTGHKNDAIISIVGHSYKGMIITYVHNPIYDKTNNVYSLYLAKNYIREDVIMLECDLYFNRELIDIILSSNNDCNILVSPYIKGIMDGSIIQASCEGKALALIIKKYQAEDYDYTNAYKTVNVYRFNKDFIANKFMPAVELYINTQSVNSYYELVLGSLIYYGNSDIRIVNISSDSWAEIDDVQDLERASILFKLQP